MEIPTERESPIVKSPMEEKKVDKSSNRFLENLPTETKPKKQKEPFQLPTVKDIKEGLSQLGRKTVSEAVASPKTLADFIAFGSNWLAEQGKKQAKKEGREVKEDTFTENVVNVLQKPKEFLENINYPSSEKVDQKLHDYSEKLGLNPVPVEPETPWQQRGANVGSFIGSSVLGGYRGLLSRLLFGGAAGVSHQAAKEAGLGEGKQLLAAMGVPALISFIAQIKSGKWKPTSEELQELMSFAQKELGMTAEEITPLLQSEGKQAFLSKIAKPTSKAAETLEQAEASLAKGYESAKTKAAKTPKLSQDKQLKILTDMEEIANHLKKSAMPTNEKVQAIEKIEKAVEHFLKEGITEENIIETWQDINRSVNWKSYPGGKKDLNRLKEPLIEALRETHPKLAEDFTKINSLWGKMKNMEEKITSNQYKKWIDYGEAYILLKGVLTGVSTGDWKMVTGVLGTEITRRLATKMLTDPKYQDIFRRTVNAVQSGNKSAGLKISKEFQKNIEKDFPEESKKVNWKKLHP